MSTKLYCQVTGIVLLAMAALSIVGFSIPGILSIAGPSQLVVTLILGALAAYAGFKDHSKMEMYARVFGVVILLLGIGGFVLPTLIQMDMTSNILYAVLGLAGVYVGYLAHDRVTQAQA